MPHYLICYDIANPKRLNKVHRRAVKHAMFIQYSVYYHKGDQSTLYDMLEEIKSVIDEQEDDVRAYTVQPLTEAIRMGKSWLPEDILLL